MNHQKEKINAHGLSQDQFVQVSKETEPATLEEARKVHWVRPDKRPLGELLDEGFLTIDRLHWAAANAYNSDLKKAAAIILRHINETPDGLEDAATQASAYSIKPIDTGMSLQEAQNIKWPFAPYKDRAIGDLLKTKEKTLKDLGYAIEKAWDQKVRRAAITLMLHSLDQILKEPPPTKKPLKVITPQRWTHQETRRHQFAMLQGAILSSMVFLVLLYNWWFFSNQGIEPFMRVLIHPRNLLTLVICFITGPIIYFVGKKIFDAVFGLPIDKLNDLIEDYRKGEQGETAATDILKQTLDGTWTLFRNVILPGRKKIDIDMVLIGPSGIWLFEVKNWDGRYRNVGEQWEYRRANDWKTNKTSPTKQAKKLASRLYSFLQADDIEQWINPVVIWANAENKPIVENPAAAVWTLDRLADEIGNIWGGKQKISEEEKQRIEDKLLKLYKTREQQPDSVNV